jgi:uncharacterized membrane protein
MKKQTQKTKSIALMGILCAIMIVMSFTPVGYLKVGTIEISLLMIPVAIGAVALGPVAGAILGAVFGITSFAQCFGLSFFGTFLCDINPFMTCVMCIVPRVLAGFCAGLVAENKITIGLHNVRTNKDRKISVNRGAITGFCAALFNTIFFMLSLLLFFWNSQTFINAVNEWGYKTNNILLFFFAFVGINCIFELIATCIVTSAIGTALEKAKLIDFATINKKTVAEAASDASEKASDIAEKAEEVSESKE